MAQENTMSLNYLNLGKADNIGWNSGVGVQVKIHLKNNWYLLPDAGYLFEKISTPYYRNDANFNRESHQYLFGNANIGYSFFLSNNLRFVLYAGAGYYHDFRKNLYVLSGSGGGYQDPSAGFPQGSGPVNILDEYSTGMIMCNLGFLAEYHLSENIFLVAGCKYMLDIYDKTNYVPYLNLGIGYRF
jgi:hypothetical protein